MNTFKEQVLVAASVHISKLKETIRVKNKNNLLQQLTARVLL